MNVEYEVFITWCCCLIYVVSFYLPVLCVVILNILEVYKGPVSAVLQLHASISPLDQKNAWFQVQFLKICNFFKVIVKALLDLPWGDMKWKQHWASMYFSNLYAGLSLPTSESSEFTLKYWAYGMTFCLWVRGLVQLCVSYWSHSWPAAFYFLFIVWLLCQMLIMFQVYYNLWFFLNGCMLQD